MLVVWENYFVLASNLLCDIAVLKRMLSEQMLITVRIVFLKALCLCSVLVCVEINLVHVDKIPETFFLMR